MKSAIAAVLVLWLCLSTELSEVAGVPDHSLILPAACAVMFWFGNGTGILIGGGALLIDWIARPTTLPLVAVLIPTAAVMLLTRPVNSSIYRRRILPALPQPLRLPLLTLVAITLHLASQLSLTAARVSLPSLSTFSHHWLDVAIVSLPISIVAALVVYAAGELGIRRSAI